MGRYKANLDKETYKLIKATAWEYGLTKGDALDMMVSSAAFLSQETREPGIYILDVGHEDGRRTMIISQAQEVKGEERVEPNE